MNLHDESGWLFGGDTKNTHNITETELYDLFDLAAQDDTWAGNVQKEVEAYDKHPHGTGIEILLDQFRIMNAGGTIIQFPFGYICTFPSRRHLFRGEV